MIIMKRESIIISVTKAMMFFALSLCIPTMAGAQDYENTPVTISREKVRVEGQVCYSHIVLEKQTLYSISKAYGVGIEDIYRYNPSVKENGLKKNSIILIPVIEVEKNDVETQAVPVVKDEEVNAKPAEAVQTAKEIKRKTHTVKWFEDIEGIAAKYNVSVDALMKANNLTGRKLAKRQKLIIPLPGEFMDEVEEVTLPAEDPAQTDTVTVADSTTEDRALFPGLFSKKEVDMTVLLPLKATGETSSRQNMDFYSGVLLAVYDMAEEGVRTNLEVYDVADGNFPTNGNILSDSDIVIGPVATADISRAFAMAPDIKALVSPLDPKAGDLAYGNKAMIQAPTPHRVQYDDLVSWIKEDMKGDDRCLVITEKGARQTEVITGMMAAIDSSGITYSPLSYSILEGRNVTESLAYLMAENATNRVYIASESEAFVNDVVRNLNLMIHKKYDVVLYAPSRIRGYETIEVDNFHNAHLHVSSGYHIDYNDDRVKEFLLRYRAVFNTEPTQFAFQGYDIARYFITLCSKYGNRWKNHLDDEDKAMLQSTFSFKKTEDGGYINNGVRRIVYEDGWNVRKVR